jgi:hypothetical protein
MLNLTRYKAMVAPLRAVDVDDGRSSRAGGPLAMAAGDERRAGSRAGRPAAHNGFVKNGRGSLRGATSFVALSV